jgi:hypothetical protein
MLAHKLANQRAAVETAIRYPPDTPAERTSVQPEEDKGRQRVGYR